VLASAVDGIRVRAAPARLLAAALVGLIAGAVAPLAATSIGLQFATACAALSLAIVSAVWLDWRRTGDIMSVLGFVALFFLLSFVAGSIWLWFQLKGQVPRVVAYHIHPHALMRAEWLAVIGWTGFALGYRARVLGLLRIPRLQLRAASPLAHDRTFAAIYIIGFAARLAAMSRGIYFHNAGAVTGTGAAAQSSSLNQIISIFADMPLVSVAYLGFRTRGVPRLRRYYVGALIVEFGLAGVSGTRGSVIGVILIVLGVALYSTGRFPVKATIVAALIGVFFVFPLLALYREASAVNGYQVSNLSTGLTNYTSGGFGGALTSGVDSTLRRFADIVGPAAMEEYGRQVYPLPFGGSIGIDFANLIPHALDPNKPVIDTFGNEIVYAYRLSPLKNSYFALSMLGEMYLDFGAIGAGIAFFVLGSVYRELNDLFGAKRENQAVGAVYLALAWPIVSTVEAFIGDQLFGLLRGLVVWIVLIKVLSYTLAGRVPASPNASNPARPSVTA
jgi:hypothetical protein